jgi:hypothetical protein
VSTHQDRLACRDEDHLDVEPGDRHCQEGARIMEIVRGLGTGDGPLPLWERWLLVAAIVECYAARGASE